MIKIKYFFLILLLFATHSYAGQHFSKINTYSSSIELIPEQKSAIYKLALPEDIYRTIIKKDLGDIRVFNQAHEPVPHIIRYSKNKSLIDSAPLKLPLFPIYTDDDSLNGNTLDITISSEDRVVSIQSEESGSTLRQKAIKHYLIDTSHIDQIIDSLDFQINDNDLGYTKTVKLEYSHDLNNWETLVQQATLTELNYGSHVLKKTRINLPGKKFKYMRFSWVSDAENLSIESVKANFRNQYLSEKRYWNVAKLINDSEQSIYEFDTGGVFNIEQINIELPEDNTLIDVTIESRADTDAEWRRQFNGLFYRLFIEDTELTGEPASVRPNKDRYWRIKLQSTDGIGQTPPILKFGWRANDLYFLARGQAPYILAYGNANVTDEDHSTSKLMNIVNQDTNGNMVGSVVLGKKVVLKGDSALKPHMKLPWERILLWTVLLIGVAIIATMVIRLSKQMAKT